MGKEFGKLIRIVGITYFRLTPYEQSPVRGLITQGLPRWVKKNAPDYVYPTVMSMLLVGSLVWMNGEVKRLKRKNPEDYVNDV